MEDPSNQAPYGPQPIIGPTAMTDPQLDVVTDGTVWRFDGEFLRSGWTCLWGDGCQGIGDEPATSDLDGCCTVGAELLDQDEAMNIAALATTIHPDRFQHHARAAARTHGVFRDERRDHTAVVDGACIFLNRPGFPGGPGCALHLEARAAQEPPLDWKPSVCWQLPIKVDRHDTAEGHQEVTVRRWTRADWGPGGATTAWCCTEGQLPAAGTAGRAPVVDSLASELEALVGTDVFVEVRHRLGLGARNDSGSGGGAGPTTG